MLFDIILVLYHNEEWLRGCVAALAASRFDLARLNLVLVDNAPDEEMLAACLDLQRQYPGFGGFEYIPAKKNRGFGVACNLGATASAAPYLFFLNVDTEIHPDCLSEIEKAIAAHPEAGAFECRQLPYELGHHIDPVTLETPWASGAALVVERQSFLEVGGFDEHIFMYCEDVDLSWRLRAVGNKIVYLPKAVVTHHVLARGETPDGERPEYIGTALNRLLLAYKYGGAGDIWRANRLYLRTLRRPRHFTGVRRLLAKGYAAHFAKLWPFLFWRWGNRALYKNAPAVLNEEHFAPERGRFVLPAPVENGPLISVVVRTHKRPGVLRGALQSLANQTYPNFEVVVVEDGEDTSRAMVESEFAHLPIRYHATGQNVGRSRAGNLGMEMARGEYINLLDDDDFFYPDHLELMAYTAMQDAEADLVLCNSMAMTIEIESQNPYVYRAISLVPIQIDRLTIFTMAQSCQIHVAGAMFKKSLFQTCGGLDEKLDAHEDWAMWLRFLAKGKRANPAGIDIARATTVFTQPFDPEAARRRMREYMKSDEAFFNDETLSFTVSMEDLRGYYDGFLADIRHLQQTGQVNTFLEKQARRYEERDG